MKKLPTQPGPLSGIRILELSRILAGPWAGQLLADYGAEVIKIERPGSGDDTRTWGPPYLTDETGRETGESAYFLSTNRGKRSVAIDMATPEGRALVRRLALDCDVLIENFKVGGLKKYGLDYASLAAEHPGLVYCSITGFGQDGPYAELAGYDAAIQAMGGLMSITGGPDDLPGGGPQKVGVAVADLMCGMYAVTAVQAALLHRQVSGRGQHIDLSLLDTQVAWLANQAANYLIGGQLPGRQGTGHPNIVPYQVFATADGHVMLAVGNDRQFARFAQLMAHPEWAGDPEFATNRARVSHRERLLPMIEAEMRERGTDDWVKACLSAGVPASPINDLAQVFADPQIQHRRMVRQLRHPLNDQLPTLANPVRFSATPIDYTQPPPLLGADTQAVLTERLGLGTAEIAKLARLGAIGLPS